MTGQDLELASLLCSRLCHDLMSPVGAFANGLELLTDERDPELRGQYLGLLEESARTSTAKLKFFRLAFGAGGGFGAMLSTAEARQVLEGLLADRKGIELGWMVTEGELPKDAVKILLNLALIAADALLRGGQLMIGAERGAAGLEIAVRAEGVRLKLDDAIRAALQGQAGDEPASSRTAAAALVALLTVSAGGTIHVSEPGEGVLLIGATLGAGA